ncbi:MAG: cell division protein FtsQ/DivIB [Bacteroidia bacterium]
MSWSFASNKHKQTNIKNIEIDIVNQMNTDFIEVSEIKNMLGVNPSDISNTIGKTNINSLESRLNAHPGIENSEVSIDVNGNLKVLVKQRRPLIRIINKNGESYYIDSLYHLMPISDKTSRRVLIVNGHINEPFNSRSNFTINQIAKNDKLRELSLLDDVCLIAKYIYSDKFLSSLIHQIYVDENSEFILVPLAGPGLIKLGNSEELNEKFQKLKLFYREGLNKTSTNKNYSALDLKFKNIVVCTKN